MPLIEYNLSVNHDQQNDQEKKLKQTLIEFILELRRTIQKLNQINERLSSKADGESYSMYEYNNNMNQYNQLINSYTAIGRKLNLIFHELQ